MGLFVCFLRLSIKNQTGDPLKFIALVFLSVCISALIDVYILTPSIPHTTPNYDGFTINCVWYNGTMAVICRILSGFIQKKGYKKILKRGKIKSYPFFFPRFLFCKNDVCNANVLLDRTCYSSSMKIKIKRIYDERAKNDGVRILVDRLWPRGISKETAAIIAWPKEITPSNELRSWFHKDPEKRFKDFEKKYKAELQNQKTIVKEFVKPYKTKTVTLVTAVKDIPHSHIPTLTSFLSKL